MNDFPSDSVINDAITNILSAPEFQPKTGLSEHIMQKIISFLSKLFTGVGGMSGLAVAVLLAVAAAVVVVIIYMVKRWRTSSLDNKLASKADSAQNYWQLAMDSAERGEFEKGLILLFLFHLKNLEERRLISLDKSKTNLQYEWELINNKYNMLMKFREFRHVFNAVRYDRQAVSGADFQVWRDYCMANKAEDPS